MNNHKRKEPVNAREKGNECGYAISAGTTDIQTTNIERYKYLHFFRKRFKCVRIFVAL